jgi:hypothetical protein
MVATSCRLLLLSLLSSLLPNLLCSKDTEKMLQMKCIYFDNSFSMQAKGKQGELLKRAVQELLEETPENTTFLYEL